MPGRDERVCWVRLQFTGNGGDDSVRDTVKRCQKALVNLHSASISGDAGRSEVDKCKFKVFVTIFSA